MCKISSTLFGKAFAGRPIAALCFSSVLVASGDKFIAVTTAASAPADCNCAKPIAAINNQKKAASIIETDREPIVCASLRFA
jgi:hypothetical protein